MAEGKFDGAFKLEGWNADPEKLFHLLSEKLGDENIKRIAEADYCYAAKKNERDLRGMLRTKTLPTKFESEFREVLELSGWYEDLESGFANTVLFIAVLQKAQCYYPRITEAYVFHHSGAPDHMDPTEGLGPYETMYAHSRVIVDVSVAPRLPKLIQACFNLDRKVLDALVSLLVSMVEEDLCRRFSLLALIIVAAHMDPKDDRIPNLIDLLFEAEAHFVSDSPFPEPYPEPQYWLLGTTFYSQCDTDWFALSGEILGKSGVDYLENLNTKLTQPP